jgi:hypothetical protein
MPTRLNAPLDRLRQQLSESQAPYFQRIEHWGAPQEMTQALRQVRSAFDSAAVESDPRSSALALSRFRKNGRFANFIELKYGCFGVGLSIMWGNSQWSILGDEELLRQLLKLVDVERKQPRRFRKCYQGLMHSYFSYPVLDEEAEQVVKNWHILRRFLGNRRELALRATNIPTWLAMLDQHANLLSSKACEPYAADLLQGNRKQLEIATEGIGIGPTSWLWQEAIITTVKTATEIDSDADFRNMVDTLLNLLVSSESDRPLSESVLLRCFAMILIRYAKSTNKPEHPRLRDLAVQHIGNPWLKRAAWDAYVNNDNARKMVDGWLKRRLITDFFAVLSEDGAADQRRLNYWLRFEPVIEDMWFALGPHAREANTADFIEMRKRMEGRLHFLSGPGSILNNAFLMKIGEFLIVEFGVTGNATYIFNIGDSKIDFSKREMNIYSLKGSNHVGRLIHMSDWEYTFDQWLCPRISWHPETGNQNVIPARHAPTHSSASSAAKRFGQHRPIPRTAGDINQVLYFIKTLNLEYEDNRGLGGPFWIRTGNNNPYLNDSLSSMGFKYAADKGWWRK